MSVRRELFVATALVALAGCAASASTVSDTTVVPSTSPPSTVGGVGVLPGPLPTQAIEEIASTTTLPVPESPERTVGALAGGNRVLMLGDSILASTSKRYGDNMCDALVPLGWQIAIEAEVSRTIDFGNTVLDRRYDEGWDAGLVLLGSNYDGDEQRFLKELNEIVDRFEGKPVVVLTVTEFQETRGEVNDVIEALAEIHPNILLVDWASMSRFAGVLSDDGLHLTTGGRAVLAQVLVPFFDVAPTQPGECLDSMFRDDSAGSVDGPGTTTRPSSGSGSRPTTTTVRPSGSTTTVPGGSATTAPSTGSTTPSVTTSPSTGTTTPGTQPPVTQPPVTQPPVTQPPATQPPATNPPATNPPPVTLPPVTSPPPEGP